MGRWSRCRGAACRALAVSCWDARAGRYDFRAFSSGSGSVGLGALRFAQPNRSAYSEISYVENLPASRGYSHHPLNRSDQPYRLARMSELKLLLPLGEGRDEGISLLRRSQVPRLSRRESNRVACQATFRQSLSGYAPSPPRTGDEGIKLRVRRTGTGGETMW